MLGCHVPLLERSYPDQNVWSDVGLDLAYCLHCNFLPSVWCNRGQCGQIVYNYSMSAPTGIAEVMRDVLELHSHVVPDSVTVVAVDADGHVRVSWCS